MKEENNPKEVSKEVSQSGDISKRTIAILLILAIIVSVTSTLIVMGSAPKVRIDDKPTAGAEVKVKVVEPPEPVIEDAQVKVNVVE